jgi:maleylacetoacetate isomerase
MKLYGYFRSSASYRVRIVLNLKGLPYDQVGVDLRKGETQTAEYRSMNPQGLVPALQDGDTIIPQSLAICEYLEEAYPTPPLLPADARGRARVRTLALAVACEIHPLNNLRVLNYLTQTLGASDEQRLAWYRHWVGEGFKAVEAMLAGSKQTGRFCHGDTPTLADAFLVPQVFNANRFGADMAPYPTIRRINDACLALPAFDRARPENQIDAA